MPDDIEQVTPADDEIEQEWVRNSEDEFRSVSANKPHESMWQVTLGLAEFLREEPLESEMRREMDRVLRAVPGVSDVTEGDRELWAVAGSPRGEDLVRAAASVVDGIADRAHEQLGF
jgi:hypothetical protein